MTSLGARVVTVGQRSAADLATGWTTPLVTPMLVSRLMMTVRWDPTNIQYYDIYKIYGTKFQYTQIIRYEIGKCIKGYHCSNGILEVLIMNITVINFNIHASADLE